MSSKNTWIFKEDIIKSCFSVRNGMKSSEVEDRRKIACRFISKIGKEFQRQQRCIATAIMYFHRFSIFGDFSKYSIHDIATTCLFLAAKVEEAPIHLQSIIQCAYFYRNDGKKKLDPKVQIDEYNHIRTHILKIEMLLLRILCYDLTIDHPYQYILKLTKKLSTAKSFDNKTERELSQFAWNFINDSLSLTLMLRFKPEVIAQSAIYLAAKKKNLEVTWSDIDVSINVQGNDQETPDHYKVMYEIISIYDTAKGHPGTPSTPSNSQKTIETPRVASNMGVETISSPPSRDWNAGQPSPATSKPPSPQQNDNTVATPVHPTSAPPVMSTQTTTATPAASAVSSLNSHSHAKPPLPSQPSLPPLPLQPSQSSYNTSLQNSSTAQVQALPSLLKSGPPPVPSKYYSHSHSHSHSNNSMNPPLPPNPPLPKNPPPPSNSPPISSNQNGQYKDTSRNSYSGADRNGTRSRSPRHHPYPPSHTLSATASSHHNLSSNVSTTHRVARTHSNTEEGEIK